MIINGRGIVQYNFEATVDEELTVDRGEQVRTTSPYFPAVPHLPRPSIAPSPPSLLAHRPRLAQTPWKLNPGHALNHAYQPIFFCSFHCSRRVCFVAEAPLSARHNKRYMTQHHYVAVSYITGDRTSITIVIFSVVALPCCLSWG